MALAPRDPALLSTPHGVPQSTDLSHKKPHSLLRGAQISLKSTPEADFLLATYLDKSLACLHVLMLFLISFTFFFFMIESLSSVVSSLSLSRR